MCLPLLGLEVAVICALDLARLHEHLGRRAIDALLEACLPSVVVLPKSRWAASYRSTTWLCCGIVGTMGVVVGLQVYCGVICGLLVVVAGG